MATNRPFALVSLTKIKKYLRTIFLSWNITINKYMGLTGLDRQRKFFEMQAVLNGNTLITY